MTKNDLLLGELLNRASARLAAYGYLLTGSQHASEDLVQDAIVKVFVRRRSLANVQAAEGYVRAAMRSIHIDRMRREKLWRKAAPGQVVGAEAPDIAERIVVSDAVGRALATLSPQQRTAVVLKYYDDLTVAGVAVEMKLAEGTVKRYLSDAMQRLAAEMGDRLVVAEYAAVTDGKDRS